MEAPFGLLGLIALLTAIVCLIRPIARIGISSRKRAVLLGIAGVILLGLAGQQEVERESTVAARSPTQDEVNANIPPSATPTAEATASAPVTPDDVKAKAQSIAFDSLAREPSKYAGTPVTFTGKVIQAQDNSRYAAYRVDVNKGEYGIWKDTIFVDYRRSSDTEPRILEGDIVRLYGNFKGLKSYKAIMGQTVTLPHVVASIVERETSTP